jgi:hypothetical protein
LLLLLSLVEGLPTMTNIEHQEIHVGCNLKNLSHGVLTLPSQTPGFYAFGRNPPLAIVGGTGRFKGAQGDLTYVVDPSFEFSTVILSFVTPNFGTVGRCDPTSLSPNQVSSIFSSQLDHLLTSPNLGMVGRCDRISDPNPVSPILGQSLTIFKSLLCHTTSGQQAAAIPLGIHLTMLARKPLVRAYGTFFPLL